MNIDNLANEVKTLDDKLSHMREELRAHCPHPDEYVRKLDEWRSPHHTKTTEFWYCDLCQQTKTRKGR